ncbi:hypothetical protein TNCV_1925021 [Trichonephila clavipes]|nr:hypothetical protein TNCV_1925021 [Trichonephila clavipes]
MGAGSLFTFMTARMGVVPPARAQTINNDPMATCTGLLIADETIKCRGKLDTGSQKSYGTKFNAEKLKLIVVEEEAIVHGTFGDIERRENTKNMFRS